VELSGEQDPRFIFDNREKVVKFADYLSTDALLGSASPLSKLCWSTGAMVALAGCCA